MSIPINNLENKTKNILQKSNINKFLNTTSQTDILSILNPQDRQDLQNNINSINNIINIIKQNILTFPEGIGPLVDLNSRQSTNEVVSELQKIRDLEKQKIKKFIDYENSLQAMSDIFESITSEGVFINEFIQYLYNTYDDEILEKISKDIRIIHSKDHYNINITNGNPSKKSTKDIPFFIKKENLTIDGSNYTYKEKYGLTSQDQQEELKKQNIHNQLMNLEEIADPQEISNPKETVSKKSFINKVNNYTINPSKEDTSLVYILIDNPALRAGTRNTLELSTFFNTLSTVELSKCYPYLNVSLILPKIFRSGSGNIYESASLTNFFRGTSNNTDKTTDLYKNISKNKIELSIAPAAGTASGASAAPVANDLMNSSNMSIFTMPQSVVDFREKRIGNYYDNNNVNVSGQETKRLNSVLDIARPFMTIKNFSVDVAPTQGLLSFKTGKLSLVLHDKSRLPEIAPFIKADLFGTSGSEIAIEYGWDSIDRDNPNNFVAQFLAANRVLEKYIITNSSFNMSNNGEVNIDLSIVLKGPIDLRTVKLAADPYSTIEKEGLAKVYNEIINTGIFNDVVGDNSYNNKNRAEIKLLFETLYRLFSTLDNNSYNEFKKNKMSLSNSQLSYEDKLLKTYINVNNNKTKLQKNTIISFLNVEGQNKRINYDSLVEEAKSDGNDDILTPKFKKFLDECDKIHVEINRNNEKVEELTKKIIRGLGTIDPFYNKDLVYDYYRVGNTKIDAKKPKYIQIGHLPKDATTSVSNDNATDYVTFGALLSSIIGQHFCNSKKYDEIQIISYTANRNAGLMAYRNLSSLMIKRSELNEFLKDLFKGGREFSIEGLLSQILNEFITTRANICYGISSQYKKDSKTGVVSPVISDVAAQNATVNQTLHRIYTSIINDRIEKINPNNDVLKDISNQDKKIQIIFPFEMPKIKLMFDTLTNKADALERTILRISVYDELDNPFSAISEILFEKDNNNKIFKTVGYLNKIKIEKGEAAFIEHGNEIFKNLIKKDYLKEDPVNSGLFVIDKSFGLMPFKSEFKKIMPSMTYGTENSAIIDASVTTINESNLNTVFLTRENSQSNQATKTVAFSKDLPLRVMPSQASLTIFGCPFVNFAQQYFLDFSTGTTIDNVYNVVGIKHDISPGKFTTSLTLSYGDIYGKYENALSTLEQSKKKVTDKKKEDEKDKDNCDKCYLDFLVKITSGESKGYEDYFAIGNKIIKSKMDVYLTRLKKQDITQLTIAQIYEFQNELIKQIKTYNKSNQRKKITVSSAVGKPQVLGETLKEAVEKLKLDINTTLFNKETQDKISIYLITDKRREFIDSIKKIKQKFATLNKNIEKFKEFLDIHEGIGIIKNYFLGLAYEFTSIPNPYDNKYRSVYYNNDGKRKVLKKEQAKSGKHDIEDKDFVIFNRDEKTRQQKYNSIYNSIKSFFICIVDCSNAKPAAPTTSAQPTPATPPAAPTTSAQPTPATPPAAPAPSAQPVVPSAEPASPAPSAQPVVPSAPTQKSYSVNDDDPPHNVVYKQINKTLLLDLKNIDKNQTFIKTFYDIENNESRTKIKIFFKLLDDEKINQIFNQKKDKNNYFYERIVNNRILSKRTDQLNILSLFSYSLFKIREFKLKNYDINELLKQVINFFKEYSKENIKALIKLKQKTEYGQYNFELIFNILKTFEDFNINDLNDERIIININEGEDIQQKIKEHSQKHSKLIDIENSIYDFYNNLLLFIESDKFKNLYNIVKEIKYKNNISILLSVFYDFYYMLKFFVLMRNDYYFNKKILQTITRNKNDIIIIGSFDLYTLKNTDITDKLNELDEFKNNKTLKESETLILNIVSDFEEKFKILKDDFIKKSGSTDNTSKEEKSIKNQDLTKEYIKKYKDLFDQEINKEYFESKLNHLDFIVITPITIAINNYEDLFNLGRNKEIEIDLNIKYFINDKATNIEYYKYHCKLIENKNKITLELVFSIKNDADLSNILIISKDIIDLQTMFKLIIKNIFTDDLILSDNKLNFIDNKTEELESQYNIKLESQETFNDFNLYIDNNNNNEKRKIKITKGKTNFTKKEIQQFYLSKPEYEKLKFAYDRLKVGETNITLRITSIPFLIDIFPNYRGRVSVLYDIRNDDLVFTKLGKTEKFYFDNPIFLAIMLKDKEFSDMFNYFYY